jgi:methionyl-tRNA synthetase
MKEELFMRVFIGGAWPYANGSLHLGHLSSLLPGDILARYFRLNGKEVLYVSGSDCNGTPIAIKAKQEGVEAKDIANRYHEEFQQCFRELGFTYDCYTRTDTSLHHEIVQAIFLRLLESGRLYTKEEEQCYCKTCEQFLPDRFVEGKCPYCEAQARGDQCDYCSNLLNPLELINRICRSCGDKPVVKSTEHYYFQLSLFQNDLEEYVSNAKSKGLWRENAIQLSERYLREGLVDRAVTRDLPIGVPVPVVGFEEKKIYVWIEAVAGYYSASEKWAIDNQRETFDFWNEDTISYYVHGKDNIPFHTIIWPAILKGIKKTPLPTHIVSNEYLTIEQKKLSTSKNWAIWVPDILKRYHPDSIRYFMTVNAPENRDADFSWREFIYSHNSELLGTYGNFVNRTLKFIEKYYEGKIPEGEIDPRFLRRISLLYETVGDYVSNATFKKGIEEIFAFIRESNKFFDVRKPWIQIKDAKSDCMDTMTTCVFIIANLAQLLNPFLPFSSHTVEKMLQLDQLKWEMIKVVPKEVRHVKPLFERIDLSSIEEEKTN